MESTMPNSKPKVSVIIPVYNVKSYVSASVHSVTEQTYRNLEILIINDGSTDGSDEICKDIAATDGRITLINQLNGGLSAARNTGIDKHTGDYIFFLDSDDCIDPETIQYLVKVAIETDADISTVGYRGVKNHSLDSRDTNRAVESHSDRILCSGELGLAKALYSDGVSMHAWGKLYKSGLFANIRYPNGRLYEDAGTTYKLFLLSSIVSVSGEKRMVRYLQRSGSITGGDFNIRTMDLIEFSEDILTVAERRGSAELVQAAKYHLFNSAAYVLDTITAKKAINRAGTRNLKRLYSIIRENARAVITNKRSSKRMKIYAYSSYLHLFGIVSVLRIKNILKGITSEIRST